MAALSRPGGYQADNLGVFIVALQNGADAFEREAHVDVEVFSVLWRHVLRVRIVHLCQGVDVVLEDVFRAGLIHANLLSAIALAEQFANVVQAFAGQLQTQDFILYLGAPELVQCLFVARPRRLFTVDQNVLVGVEVEAIELVLNQVNAEIQAVLQALQLTLVHGKTNTQIALQQQIVQTQTVAGEGIDVLLGKQAALRVQMLEVGVVHLRRQGIVETSAVVMVAAQQLYCILAGHYLIASGLQLIQIQCRDLFECQNAAADSQQGEQAGAAQEGETFHLGYRVRREYAFRSARGTASSRW